jgi:hypothetical protein
LRRSYLARYFFRPRKPVSWLDPVQLAGTGAKVFLADRLGAYLDKRELQAVFPQEYFDEQGGERGLWLDYLADTGDGFNATYSVAYHVASDSLTVGAESLPRADVVVMGGDQVYPTPSENAYADRLRGPFRAALPAGPGEPGPDAPRLYALPGNHDWYDGLTAFFRVFAGAESSIGRWRTRQQRSYFALKLPDNWWLFAIDAQYGTHIDDPQLDYFHRMIRYNVEEGDRIVMCTPEPGWVQSKHKPGAYDRIDYFMRKVISPEGQRLWLRRTGDATEPKHVTVPLMLSGDWHHYARYEAVETDSGEHRELITAGGGGAYLYPTHQLPRHGVVPPPQTQPAPSEPATSATATYRLRRRFPGSATSLWLGLGALVRIPLRNWRFVAALGAFQAILLYALRERTTGQVTPAVLLSASSFLVFAYFLAGWIGTETRRPLRVLGLTLLHTAAQLAVGSVGLRWWPSFPDFDTTRLTRWAKPWPWVQTAAEWVLAEVHKVGEYALYAPVAGVASAVVVAAYFFVASLVNVNVNELFAGQRIEGYKNFVRMHFAPDGTLTIYSIGLRRVRALGPSTLRWNWRINRSDDPHAPWFRPRFRQRPHLIEKVTIGAGHGDGGHPSTVGAGDAAVTA